MVNVKEETNDGNLEILQQSQMPNENKKASAVKGPKKVIVADATKNSTPGVTAKKTRDHHTSYKEIKGSRKHCKFEDTEGATGSMSLQTPINLFEDECVFCHSFRTTEFHGLMIQLQYLDGKLVPCEKDSPTNSNTMYVHKKCMEWAPKVYYEGDTIKNVKEEIHRASKLRCNRCRLPGAALGCYSACCTKSFHVPCAVMILDCRWDIDNLCVLCPEHASEVLPCDKISSPKKESGNSSGIPQNHSNQYSVKKKISVNCQIEDEQIDQRSTTYSSLPGQYSEKEVFANYQKEEKQIDQSTLSCPTYQRILLGLALNSQQKDALKDFAFLTNATVTEEWDRNVTHVIVGTDAGLKCSRSFEVLMAILSGKWVVTAGWIMDSLGEPIPGAETHYEVKFCGSHTSMDGPKKGRTRAAEGAPKLFSGLYFCLSTFMNPEEKEHIQNLIAAAEGQILEGNSLHLLRKHLDKNPVNLYFIYDAGPPKNLTSSYPHDLQMEVDEAVGYVASGAQVISHLRVFDAIAAYDAQNLNCRDDHLTLSI